MSLRRADGFIRYAISLQYHGLPFLGWQYQGSKREDCILPDGTDLRGYRSVEGCLREALTNLLSIDDGNEESESVAFENIQISSRTDRGVHAIKNTLHVDIRHNEQSKEDFQMKLHRGLNYYLSRQGKTWDTDREGGSSRRRRRNRKRRGWQHAASYSLLGEEWSRKSSTNQELRILSAVCAPESMFNPYHLDYPEQPSTVDWNARFSATQRTYMYRILYHGGDRASVDWGIPFEWDRSWSVVRGSVPFLDVKAMNTAAQYLEGTHDFSSFRASNCQRVSPIVNMRAIRVFSRPYDDPMFSFRNHHDDPDTVQRIEENSSFSEGILSNDVLGSTSSSQVQLVTIQITGDSFLYRQVRNMVGFLVEVGRGNVRLNDVPEMLNAKDRTAMPSNTAPAHGLYLVDVQHGDFKF